MKIQRKLLTKEQKMVICKKQKECASCPLYAWINSDPMCWLTVNKVEQEIKNFWCEEVEV